LYWNGTILQTGLKEDIAGSDNDKFPVVPAVVTPFLFLPIPVNFADAELLSTISGIGPELAAQIIATRNAKGQFSSPQDLLAVPGIGPSRMSQFAPQFSFTFSQ
jgi:competence ComEA-like helix-hairpin-helix protein